MMSVKPVLGTMTFGPQVDASESTRMIGYFLASGYQELDTAHVYNNGMSEKYLGAACRNSLEKRPSVATKVNPRVTGKLDRRSIYQQIEGSLERLQLDSLDTLYLHFPDPYTPMEQTLEVCAELHQKGYFRELGLSNYASWEVVHVWHLCKHNGWVLPSVYQGLYNGLSRAVESELIPAIRALGMRFYAYNPLAGGMLSGKYIGFDNPPGPGRFTHRPNYRERYWKEDYFQALNILQKACDASDVSLVEAAFRWLDEHSSLDAESGDGVLIGASSLAQLEQNIGYFGLGPLPRQVVDAFDAAWSQARSEAPSYFRTVV